MLDSQQHAAVIRNRLRNPENAVHDDGIDLKRKKTLPVTKLKLVQRTPVAAQEVLLNAGVEEVPTNVVDLPVPVARPSVIYRRYPTLQDIMDDVCAFYQVREIDILSERRGNDIMRPRQVMFYLQRMLTIASYPSIGRFGNKDHTSVIHAARKIGDRMKFDDRLHDEIQLLQIKISERMKVKYLPPAYTPVCCLECCQ